MKNFFRKVAFGIGLFEKIPSDPLTWATSQITDKIPEFSWKGKYILSEKEMRKTYWREYRYKEDYVFRKKYKTDPEGFEKARKQLKKDTGKRFWPNNEICIRHTEAVRSNSPVLAKLWFFWANHFTISDTQMLRYFSNGPYQREFIRANMNQNFEKMAIEGTLAWPMILHLDNKDNVGPKSISAKQEWRRKEKRPATINENHARELMELHTISPKAGYTQKDVIELAKIMTGWGLPWTRKADHSHDVKFDSEHHEPGKKYVLGKKYKRGKKSIRLVIKDLVNHPSCREFVATKLCRYLITDNPTKEMITPIIKAWEKSDGYLPEVHKAAIKVAFEFNDKHRKFQNPENWWLQMVRMCDLNWPPDEEKMATYILGKEPRAVHKEPKEMLWKMGHNPYKPKQPNGWPDLAADWMSPELMIRRLIFANEGYHKMKPENQNTEFYEKIVNKNFDNPNKILDILNKKAQPEDKHVLLFNLPEVLKS